MEDQEAVSYIGPKAQIKKLLHCFPVAALEVPKIGLRDTAVQQLPGLPNQRFRMEPKRSIRKLPGIVRVVVRELCEGHGVTRLETLMGSTSRRAIRFTCSSLSGGTSATTRSTYAASLAAGTFRRRTIYRFNSALARGRYFTSLHFSASANCASTQAITSARRNITRPPTFADFGPVPLWRIHLSWAGDFRSISATSSSVMRSMS